MVEEVVGLAWHILASFSHIKWIANSAADFLTMEGDA